MTFPCGLPVAAVNGFRLAPWQVAIALFAPAPAFPGPGGGTVKGT